MTSLHQTHNFKGTASERHKNSRMGKDADGYAKPKVVKMESRTTLLSAPRPISASGKPSEEPIEAVTTADSQRHFPQQFLSEYERSFRPFEKYYYDNGAWILRKQSRDAPREWIGELRDNRQRALENKARSRGDHFSSAHLLQIPSNATAYWQPSSDSLYHEPWNSENNGEQLTDRSNHSSSDLRNLVNTYCQHTDTMAADHMKADALKNGGYNKRHSSPVTPKTNEIGVITRASTLVSQATQTFPDLDLKTPLCDHAVQVGKDILTHEETFRVRPSQSPDRTRLEILRRAKYFDAKDVAPSATVLPRSMSMRSVTSPSGDQESTYHSVPPARDRRPRSVTLRSSVTSTNANGRYSHPLRSLSASQSKLHQPSHASQTATINGHLPAVSSPIPDIYSRRSVDKENRQNNQETRELITNTPIRQIPPPSAFMISPPQKNFSGRKKGVTAEKDFVKSSPSWNLSPPRRQSSSQSLKACTVSKSVVTPFRPRNNRREKSKDQFSAWIDL